MIKQSHNVMLAEFSFNYQTSNGIETITKAVFGGCSCLGINYGLALDSKQPKPRDTASIAYPIIACKTKPFIKDTHRWQKISRSQFIRKT